MSSLSIKAVKLSSAELPSNLIWHFKWNIFSHRWSQWNATLVIQSTHTHDSGTERSCKSESCDLKEREGRGTRTDRRRWESREKVIANVVRNAYRERRVKIHHHSTEGWREKKRRKRDSEWKYNQSRADCRGLEGAEDGSTVVMETWIEGPRLEMGVEPCRAHCRLCRHHAAQLSAHNQPQWSVQPPHIPVPHLIHSYSYQTNCSKWCCKCKKPFVLTNKTWKN